MRRNAWFPTPASSRTGPGLGTLAWRSYPGGGEAGSAHRATDGYSSAYYLGSGSVSFAGKCSTGFDEPRLLSAPAA
jgi:hypothetical protein